MDISEVVVRSHRMRAGSVAQHLKGFATELAEVGYTSLTINDFLISAIHFGAWLEVSGQSLDEVGKLTVFAFGAHRCKCPGLAARNVFRDVSRHVFSASLTTCSNREAICTVNQ